MSKGFDFGEAAAVRMMASDRLSTARQRMVEDALSWRTGGQSGARLAYLKRVADRYARLLAAKGANGG